MDQRDSVIIYNATDKEVSTKAFGNWFSFKPNQKKIMRVEIGEFLGREKGYLGLVELPDAFMDPGYEQSEEGKEALEQKRKEGIAKRVQHLQGIVNNLNISLRRDLEVANIKADPLSFASDGELDAMRELTGYQRMADDMSKKRLEEARKLERQLKANQNSAANTKE